MHGSARQRRSAARFVESGPWFREHAAHAHRLQRIDDRSPNTGFVEVADAADAERVDLGELARYPM